LKINEQKSKQDLSLIKYNNVKITKKESKVYKKMKTLTQNKNKQECICIVIVFSLLMIVA